MICLNKLFIKAFSPNEQLVMLHLLLNADETGMTEFSDRGISKATNIPYQQVRTIHQKWSEDGTITNAPTNAPDNAKRCFVTICDYDSYNAINIFSNAVANAVTNALKEVEITKDKEKDFPHTPLQRDIENNKDEDIKEEESNDSKKKDELFESCWKAYRRKGSKAKALTYWKKLKEEEREKVMPHIQVYVSSREKQYQKDFERYLRDKTFNEIIVKGNDTIYDPLKVENPNDYHPLTDDVFQTWNEERKCLRFNGDLNHLNDGYTDDTRPDGAMVSWGMYSWKWSKELKKWVEA